MSGRFPAINFPCPGRDAGAAPGLITEDHFLAVTGSVAETMPSWERTWQPAVPGRHSSRKTERLVVAGGAPAGISLHEKSTRARMTSLMAICPSAGHQSLMRIVSVLLVSALLSLVIYSCKGEKKPADMNSQTSTADDPMQNKGIGPVKSVTLGPLDAGMASKGKAVFTAKCSACHKLDEQVVGPALRGVTKRRSPEWIMNLILNTNEMVEKDPIVKRLVAETFQKMTFQDVSEPDARNVLEFFRQNDNAP